MRKQLRILCKKILQLVLVSIAKRQKYYAKLLGKCYNIVYHLSPRIGYLVRAILTHLFLLFPEHLTVFKEVEEAFAGVEGSQIDFNVKSCPNYFKKKLKIGFLDHLSIPFIYSKEFWENIPNEFEIVLYDLIIPWSSTPRIFKEFLSQRMAYREIVLSPTIQSLNRIFFTFNLMFDHRKLAQLINSDNLDFLIVTLIGRARFSYASLFDLLSPSLKVILLNTGNIPLFHPKVSWHGQPQLHPYWTIKDKRLVGRWTNEIINDYLFDPRLWHYNIPKSIIDKSSSANRKSWIFVYGRLKKICNKDYLKIIACLLEEDKRRKFIFMGYPQKGELNFIITYFKNKGLESQIKYGGKYTLAIQDSSFLMWQQYLKTSAVFLNPFPASAGAARMEAFASGLPVIEMGVPPSPFQKCWINYSLSMDKKLGVAYSWEEYLQLARRIFHDSEFRHDIVKEQFKIACDYCSPQKFWDKLVRVIYEELYR